MYKIDEQEQRVKELLHKVEAFWIREQMTAMLISSMSNNSFNVMPTCSYREPLILLIRTYVPFMTPILRNVSAYSDSLLTVIASEIPSAGYIGAVDT